MTIAHSATGGDALATFQAAFAQALRSSPGEHGCPSVAALVSQPGFAVYRNTVIKGCIDALQANFPAVARLVGEEWFRAAAAIYVRETPPEDPTLLNYGATFAAFLSRFAPAAKLPYLPGVARLDQFWTEAHVARDEEFLDPAAISSLSPDLLGSLVLHPHPAARWAWFADAPVFSIWSRNRCAEMATDDDWQPPWIAEGALITRVQGTVEWNALDAAGVAFLDACAGGKALPQAAAAALAARPDSDLKQLMATLLQVGALSHMNLIQHES